MSIKSPFPGMDPFMERRSIWRGIHFLLISAIFDMVSDTLPDNFEVDIEGELRVVRADDDKTINPDLYIVKRSPIRGVQSNPVMIREPIAIKPITTTVEDRWLKIIDRKSRQVVTTIEVLSPRNKVGDGYEAFSKKREAVKNAGGNWLEIDLLQIGKRPDYAIELPEYYAMMMRGDDAEAQWYVWPMPLQEPLPTIAVPLSDGYDDLPLDLQHAVNVVYRKRKFWRNLEYSEDVPAPRLSAENQSYVAQKLTAWKNAQSE